MELFKYILKIVFIFTSFISSIYCTSYKIAPLSRPTSMEKELMESKFLPPELLLKEELKRIIAEDINFTLSKISFNEIKNYPQGRLFFGFLFHNSSSVSEIATLIYENIDSISLTNLGVNFDHKNTFHIAILFHNFNKIRQYAIDRRIALSYDENQLLHNTIKNIYAVLGQNGINLLKDYLLDENADSFNKWHVQDILFHLELFGKNRADINRLFISSLNDYTCKKYFSYFDDNRLNIDSFRNELVSYFERRLQERGLLKEEYKFLEKHFSVKQILSILNAVLEKEEGKGYKIFENISYPLKEIASKLNTQNDVIEFSNKWLIESLEAGNSLMLQLIAYSLNNEAVEQLINTLINNPKSKDSTIAFISSDPIIVNLDYYLSLLPDIVNSFFKENNINPIKFPDSVTDGYEKLKLVVDYLFLFINSLETEPKIQKKLLFDFLSVIFPPHYHLPRNFAPWFLQDENPNYKNISDFLKQIISKNKLLQEKTNKTNVPYFYLVNCNLPFFRDCANKRLFILEQLNSEMKSSSPDNCWIAHLFFMVGDISDPLFFDEIQRIINPDNINFSNWEIQESLLYMFENNGKIGLLDTWIPSSIIKDYDLKKYKQKIEYHKTKIKRNTPVIRAVRESINASSFPVLSWQPAKLDYRTYFFMEKNMMSRIDQYYSSFGGMIIWNGSEDLDSWAGAEGYPEGTLVDSREMLGAILPENITEILNDISNLKSSDLNQPSKINSIISKFKDKMAILDLISRGLKIPIDVEPQIILKNIWTYLKSGNMEIFDLLPFNHMVQKLSSQKEGNISKENIDAMLEKQIQTIKTKINQGVFIILPLIEGFPYNDKDQDVIRKIFFKDVSPFVSVLDGLNPFKGSKSA